MAVKDLFWQNSRQKHVWHLELGSSRTSTVHGWVQSHSCLHNLRLLSKPPCALESCARCGSCNLPLCRECGRRSTAMGEENSLDGSLHFSFRVDAEFVMLELLQQI